MDISEPILVTGAKGFIGANLVRKLLEKHDNIHVILRNDSGLWRLADILDKVQVHYLDLLDRQSVFSLVEQIKPKTIFHLAAYGAYPFQKEVDRIMAVNLHGTVILLDACTESGFSIFINTGSSSEYGFKQEPMKESDILEPNSYYAVFKAAATHYCQYEAQSKKLPIITLRPFSVYGPYEEPTRLVPVLITKLFKGQVPPLASPEIARDYIYVEDMVDAYLKVAVRPDLGGQIFNVGSGIQTSLKQIVDTAVRLNQAQVELEWGTMENRIWDQNVWQADIGKIKKMTDWQPRFNLEDGLRQSIGWFKENIHLYKKNEED